MKLHAKIDEMVEKHPRFIIAICLSFFLVLSLVVGSDGEDLNSSKPQAVDIYSHSMDTFIPAGFVLVPIEIQNLASLDSIVGQYGLVSLFTPGDTDPVIRDVKLIRSPRDPSQFAVLAPEHLSKKIVLAGEKPFFVSVQNPNSNRKARDGKAHSTRIQWENSL